MSDGWPNPLQQLITREREMCRLNATSHSNQLQAELDAAKARIRQLERQRLYWFEYATSRMAADEAPKPLDGTPGAVQGRVDGVIQDALEGRLTPSQKSGIRTSIDRSDRVSRKSDAAVGKAIGG